MDSAVVEVRLNQLRAGSEVLANAAQLPLLLRVERLDVEGRQVEEGDLRVITPHAVLLPSGERACAPRRSGR